MRILVMGATGNVGGALVTDLLARGAEVRAISRRAQDWPEGVEALVGDPGEPASLVGAGEGVDGAFLMSGYAVEAQILRELSGAPVALLSASSAPRAEAGNAMAAYHHASELAVAAAGGPWTVVRPCSFQSNVARWRDQFEAGDVVRAPFGDVPVAVIDPADIAAVVAMALSEPGHSEQTYRLSGPEALTPGDQVAVVADALGRSLRFDAIPDDEARPMLTEQMGEAYAAALFEIFREHPGSESEVQPTVQELLGRPPASLSDWVQRNRQLLG